MLLAIKTYICWILAYGFLIFIVLKDRIERKGNMTQFKVWFNEKAPLYKYVLILGERWCQFFYLCGHFLFCV